MMTRTTSRALMFVVLALATLLVSAPASAQSTGTLQGTVTDAQAAVLPGVSIVLRNTATGIERAVVTDEAGQYAAASLPPGHYLVTAHLEGFEDQKREIDIGPAQTIGLNLRLGLGT